MISRFLQGMMVITSISPVFFTLWFKEYSENWNIKDGLIYLVISFFLIAISYLILGSCKKKLEIIDIKINNIGPADKELFAYIFAYLLPLINVSSKMLFFILLLFSIVAFTTNIYHFNPIFGLLHYHFYSVSLQGGVSYVLMTKKRIRNTTQISRVVFIGDYILLDVT